MSMPFSRRSLLQALTVGAGSLAFGARSLGGRVAHAAPATVPGRLVIFPVGLGGGVSPDYTLYAQAPSLPPPTGRGASVVSGATTNFTLGPILQPFADLGLQNQLVFLRGLEYRTGWYGDAHLTGAASMLTGGATQAQDGTINPAHQSIDQYLATKIGAGMPWPWLGTRMCGSTCSFDANLNGVYGFYQDPVAAYTKVFGNLSSTGPDPALLRRLARRQSVLDAVSTDVNAFVKRLPAEDRMRAEAQIAAIQAMESQIKQQSGGSTCANPTMAQPLDYSQPVNLPSAMRAFTDIAVAAMACDLTRVVLMTTTVQYTSMECAYAPVNQPDSGHHALSHGTDDSGTANSSGQSVWVTERQFLHQLVAELAQKLQNIPEAGGTMLDHTIILIPSENGVMDGHNYYDLCWTTVGGKGLGVKTGQYMALGQICDGGGAVPVQRLFVSILNALGLPDQTFNDDPSNTGSGPLPGYLV